MISRRSFVLMAVLLLAVLVGLVTFNWFDAKCVVVKSTLIHFPQVKKDMGQLKKGKPQTVSFVFSNEGEHPLVIQQVEASCGCTQPEWPKHPIKPGQSGEIMVTYDAKYPGRFVKSIQVFCNSDPGMVELLITGDVLD